MSANTSSDMGGYELISPLKKGGKRKLVDCQDNIYIEERLGSDATYYRCHRRREGCNGRGILRHGVFIQSQQHDQHSGDAVQVEKIKMRINLHKVSVSNQFALTSTIVQEVTASLTDEAVLQLPKQSALLRDVQRARAKAFGSVTRPASRQELQVPGPLNIDLMPMQPKCTTPMVPTPRGCSCCQATLDATQAKVAALEQELSQMRAMMSTMLTVQGKIQGALGEVVPPTPPPGNPSVPTTPSVAPPPPPPPPPPMNNAPLTIKLRTGKGSNDGNSPNLKPVKAQTASMLDVLKDLAYVKLRSIAKSPGGTPMKKRKPDNENDPTAMIAAALKKRFAIIHSPGSEADSDDDRFVDKENLGGRVDDEAFSDCSPPKASVFRRHHLFERDNVAGGPKGKNPRK